jgi:hypothetical protein
MDKQYSQKPVVMASLPQSFVPLAELLDINSAVNDNGRSGKKLGTTYFTEMETGRPAIAVAHGNGKLDLWSFLQDFTDDIGSGGSGLTPAQVARLGDMLTPLQVLTDYIVPVYAPHSADNSGVVLDVFPDDGTLVVELPDPLEALNELGRDSFSVTVYNQTNVHYNITVVNHLGELVVVIPPVNGYTFFYDNNPTGATVPWIGLHIQGEPVPTLDPVLFGDFDSPNYSTLYAKVFTVTARGDQVPRSPYKDELGNSTLLPLSTYTFEFTQVNILGTFSQQVVMISTDSDFTNPDLERIYRRGGADFGSTLTVGWKKYSLTSDGAFCEMSITQRDTLDASPYNLTMVAHPSGTDNLVPPAAPVPAGSTGVTVNNYVHVDGLISTGDCQNFNVVNGEAEALIGGVFAIPSGWGTFRHSLNNATVAYCAVIERAGQLIFSPRFASTLQATLGRNTNLTSGGQITLEKGDKFSIWVASDLSGTLNIGAAIVSIVRIGDNPAP